MTKNIPERAKGGFQDNPQNINRKGRPKKGYSITEWFKEMLDSKPEVKDAVGKAILKKALEGDIAAQKLVWNYMDGMPISDKGSTTNIFGDVQIAQIKGMTDEQIISRITELERALPAQGGNGDSQSE